MAILSKNSISEGVWPKSIPKVSKNDQIKAVEDLLKSSERAVVGGVEGQSVRVGPCRGVA